MSRIRRFGFAAGPLLALFLFPVIRRKALTHAPDRARPAYTGPMKPEPVPALLRAYIPPGRIR